jgi:hypothetical protein
MKKIRLKNYSKPARVDNEDYARVNQFDWYAVGHKGGGPHAVRFCVNSNGQQCYQLMEHLVLGFPPTPIRSCRDEFPGTLTTLKHILLSDGGTFIPVEDAYFDRVSEFKWHAVVSGGEILPDDAVRFILEDEGKVWVEYLKDFVASGGDRSRWHELKTPEEPEGERRFCA